MMAKKKKDKEEVQEEITEEVEKEEEPEEKEEELSPEQEIEKLNEEIAILKNEYAKAYADTENTRRRLQTEFEQLSKYQMQNFALDILPVLDNCERALAQETTDEAYRKGVEMIYEQLKQALSKEGVEEIEALDQPFDPNWHQALLSEKVEGKEPGVVIEVLQKGYKLKDRILRASMVKVSE